MVQSAWVRALEWCLIHFGTKLESESIPKAGRSLREMGVHCLLWLMPQRLLPGNQPRLYKRGMTRVCVIDSHP